MSIAVWVGVVLLTLALALAPALSSSPYPCIPDPDSFELLVATKLLLLDCDSTLSSIEGIDELGRLRGSETFKAVEDMTNAAMDGGTPMEAIFAKRLDIIKPTKAELEAIGAKYIATVEPTAKATLDQLRAAGWKIAIVSGGFTQAILPHSLPSLAHYPPYHPCAASSPCSPSFPLSRPMPLPHFASSSAADLRPTAPATMITPPSLATGNHCSLGRV